LQRSQMALEWSQKSRTIWMRPCWARKGLPNKVTMRVGGR
jgi:hypothetical protein